MKKVSLLVVLLSTVSFAQQATYPLHVGNMWVYHNSHEIRIIGDTLLSDGKKYSIFGDSEYYFYTYYVRQDGDKVYYFQPPYDSTEELRYDFAHSPGDTIWKSPTGFEVLTSISFDTVFGATRKVFGFKECDYDCYDETDYKVADSIGLIYRIFFPDVAPPIYEYLTGAIIDGKQYGTITNLEQHRQELPVNFTLYQNYPNPFNPSTTLLYELPEQSLVTIKVFNILGQEIASLVNEKQDAGSKSVRFTASNLPSGFYFYRMTAIGANRSFTQTNKMLFVK